jgi:hypothetical protein
MKSRVIGFDIGTKGAMALLENGELVDIKEMPILRDGPKNRPTVNAPLLADLGNLPPPSSN